MTGTGDRFECELEADGRLHRVTAAWRGLETGFGVLYFLVTDDPAGDRGDRRALLTPEHDLATMEQAALLALYESGRPLTETERRFSAPDGRRWLAQSRGPVWAGRSGAEGGFGILFTSLEGEPEVLRASGPHVGEIPDQELSARWDGAAQRRAAGDASTRETDDRPPEEPADPA